MTVDEFLFVNIPSEPRTKTMEAAVMVEAIISTMLSLLLRIKDNGKKPFAKSIKELTFSQKLALLSDIDAISSEEKGKLQKFSEIRNLFAHQASIIFFYQCFENYDLNSFLEKRYGTVLDNAFTGEQRSQQLFDLLFKDVKAICKNLFELLLNNSREQGKMEGKVDFYNLFYDNAKKMDDAFLIKFNKLLDITRIDFDRLHKK